MEILTIILAVIGVAGLTLIVWKLPKQQAKKKETLPGKEAENTFHKTENQLTFEYDGGTVSRSKLEEAIDFFISIEPHPGKRTATEEYEANLIRYKKEIELAELAIRSYAEQIRPLTIEAMQDEFYSITNSEKYLQSMIHSSVAYSLLNSHWNGVGPWIK